LWRRAGQWIVSLADDVFVLLFPIDKKQAHSGVNEPEQKLSHNIRTP
jgi:hypothetical protein